MNALAAEMQSTQLVCADPGRWADGGHVIGFVADDTDAEAGALLEFVSQVLHKA